jgi:hypothetical protein
MSISGIDWRATQLRRCLMNRANAAQSGWPQEK